MIHVNCAAYGLYRMCEAIKLEYPNIDNMISRVKKCFQKAPIQLYVAIPKIIY